MQGKAVLTSGIQVCILAKGSGSEGGSHQALSLRNFRVTT